MECSDSGGQSGFLLSVYQRVQGNGKVSSLRLSTSQEFPTRSVSMWDELTINVERWWSFKNLAIEYGMNNIYN